jgi:hypothetical protein
MAKDLKLDSQAIANSTPPTLLLHSQRVSARQSAQSR